jgi:hypothetical protein
MGRPIRDLAGQPFGRLIAREPVGRDNGHVVWRCDCACGNEARVSAPNLKGGRVLSCGCLLDELRCPWPPEKFATRWAQATSPAAVAAALGWPLKRVHNHAAYLKRCGVELRRFRA